MKSKNNIFVFFPTTLKFDKTGYLQGTCKEINGFDTYFITHEQVLPSRTSECVGEIVLQRNLKSGKVSGRKFVYIDGRTKKVTFSEIYEDCAVVQIYYDFNKFKKTYVIDANHRRFGEHFVTLHDELTKNAVGDDVQQPTGLLHVLAVSILWLLAQLLQFFEAAKPVLRHSTTVQHFAEGLVNLKWFLNGLLHGQKSLKFGNAFLAKLVDVVIGVVLVNLFLAHQHYIFDGMQHVFEGIIQGLKELLTYLMGAPIGLKLNDAFNRYLGTFFFYNMSLWRVFLKEIQPLFVQYFKYLVYLGCFGCSFQIAMLSDIIAIATFHVYCIYVYAARLFSLQVNGIISLWRLFIGRKYNPLRQRVDSFNYSQNQLFIGTLGFTVLLFLLPTTTMYYAVFATFRLGMLCIDTVLWKIRYHLNRLPIYVVTLWIFNSACIAGNVYFIWRRKKDDKSVYFEVKLYALPLLKSIKRFVPYESCVPVDNYSFSHVVRSILTGVII